MDLAKLDHLLSVLRARIFAETGVSVPLVWAEAPPARRDEMLAGPHPGWAPVTPETIWGRPQSYFWFAGRVAVPEALAGRRLYLRIEAQFGRVMGRSDPQCLVRIDGEIAQGADFNHREVLLTASAEPGRDYGVMVEAGTIEDRRQIGFGCALVVHDPDAEALWFDLATPLDVARHLPENDHRRDAILSIAAEALNALDLRQGDPGRFAASVARAREIAAGIYALADTEVRPEITVTGHTHIDVAWLWRVRETRQKMARSMATALALMEEYPDYRFMYNQGYLLDTLAQEYPELFDRLKARQAAGQVEIEGALWLEPDANMTGGESLVRHITRGIRYHQETFGVRPRIVWLPDTFGYSSALPQLMARAGLEVFVTHKMSWNDTNRMPHEIFWWEGHDGTRVPTYFLTTQPMESNSIGTTYCPDLTASHVMGAWRRYGQKGGHDALFLVYGHGDGGGGPTRGMLEHIRRMERGIPGCPRVIHGTMGGYFEALLAGMRAAPEAFPSWVGELYLEFHRGTFTSVAEVKRNNRRAEATMRELEMLAVLAWVAGGEYPAAEIEALWDIVLLNQFHDILPGSSIAEVYADSRTEFAAFFAAAARLRDSLAAPGGGLAVANPLGQPRTGLLALASDTPVTIDGTPSQRIYRADGTAREAAPIAPVPALGLRAVAIAPGPAAAGTLDASPSHLENAKLRATFDAQGRLESLTDKASGRQLLAGPGNRLQAFRDLPAQFDAWDIDLADREQSWEIDRLVSAQLVETGPHRAAIRFEWTYERSRITQIVSLEAEGQILEFDTYIDWRDPNTLLKSTFPTAFRATQSHAETQFGHVTRPTHANTSWDRARFECPMHRWVALTEPGLGLAVLNDCKYGYDAEGSTLRLTLLRAPTWPWDGADIGEHRFRYGLMPFRVLAEVPPAAEGFNAPLEARAGGGTASLAQLDTAGIAVEAAKRAEDGKAVILRLWEREGRRQEARLTPGFATAKASEADLLEIPQTPLALENGTIALTFAPFEIKTIRLELA